MRNVILFILIFASLNLTAQRKLEDFKKGEFRLKLGLPYLIHLLLKPSETITVNKVGFLGENIGLEYSYSDNKFLEFSFSFVGAADCPIPFQLVRKGSTPHNILVILVLQIIIRKIGLPMAMELIIRSIHGQKDIDHLKIPF